MAGQGECSAAVVSAPETRQQTTMPPACILQPVEMDCGCPRRRPGAQNLVPHAETHIRKQLNAGELHTGWRILLRALGEGAQHATRASERPGDLERCWAHKHAGRSATPVSYTNPTLPTKSEV